MSKIRVLIVDDHAILRMGLSSLLRQKTDIEVVGDADGGESAIRKVQKLRPDVVIMDLMMPGMDGTEATRRIVADNPGIRVLILTTFGTADGLAHAIEAGAQGAILKSANFPDLVEAVRTVARGDRYVSPDISSILAEEPPVPELSERQAEILKSIIRGLTNKEIADNLGISLQRVKEHVSALLLKIGATNRSEAAVIALRKHLLKM